MTAEHPEQGPMPDRVAALEEEIAELKEQMADRDERIDALEEKISAEVSSGSAADDRYDAPVIERLNPGTQYRARELKQMYLTHTPIQHMSTAKKRIKNLTSRPEFERAGHARWTYRGEADE